MQWYVGKRPSSIPIPRRGSSNYNSVDRQDAHPPATNGDAGTPGKQEEPIRVSRDGQAIPVTIMPHRSELLDSGYVDSITHTPELQQKVSPPNSLLNKVRDILVTDKPQTPSPHPSNPSLDNIVSDVSNIASNQSLETENNVRMDKSSSLISREGAGRPSLDPLLLRSPNLHGGEFVLNSPGNSPDESRPMTMVGIESDAFVVIAPCRAQPTRTYFQLALCSTILCCFPIGLIALLHSYQVRKCTEERASSEAEKYSAKAKHTALFSIFAGGVFWIVITVTLTVILVLKYAS